MIAIEHFIKMFFFGSKMRLSRILIASLIAVTFFGSFVSAYYLPPVRQVVELTMRSFVDIFEPILQTFIGGDIESSLLFEKLLIFIILLCLVYVSIGFVPLFEDYKWGRWVVAIIVPLMGVRFLDTGWVLAIIIQYKVLAIALTGILPFVIYFFFLHNVSEESSVIRKIGWVFFIIIYLGLWATVENESYSSIYFWTMVASLLFMLFDGTIHRIYVNQEMKKAGSTDKWQHIAKLRRDISETNSDMRSGHIPERIGKRIIKKKERQIEWLLKH